MMMHKKLNDSDQENELKEVFRVFGKDETGNSECVLFDLFSWSCYPTEKKLVVKQFFSVIRLAAFIPNFNLMAGFT